MAQDASLKWQEAAAGSPRFHGPARRLLVEGARQNYLRNPRGEGSALNTSGSLPTYWAPLGTEQVERQIVGAGTEDGLPYVDVRFFGSAQASSTGLYLLFEGTTALPAMQGEVWTLSAFVRVVAGSLGTSLPSLLMTERTSTGAYVYTGFGDVMSGAPGRLATQRLAYSRALIGGSTARLAPGLYVKFATGEFVDLTLRIGAPQLEKAAFASSPVLPPVGAPATALRAADLPVWAPLGGFGNQGTVVMRAMLPNAAPAAAAQGLLQIDDGTDQNRLVVRNASGGSAVYGVVDSAGTTVASLAGGNTTPGTPFQVAFAWGPGDQAFCLNGGPVQSAAAALPAGLSRMLIGHASGAADQAAYGEIELVDYRPQRLPNAMLQTLTAA